MPFQKSLHDRAITSFKFCITQLKLTASDGSELQANGSSAITADLGLIDLGDGTAIKNWGTVTVPAGAAVKTVKVEVHKDADKCSGANYSVNINNGQTLTQDLEFKFSFANAKALDAGDTVNFVLTNLVQKFGAALLAGQFDDSHITSYMETLEDDTAE